VAAIESKLLSLIDPVLPPGYGFSVIDDEGVVQFHSDSNRNLRENLFNELDADVELRGALLAQRDEHFDAVYQTAPIYAFVTQLAGTRWSLVVFADRERIRDMEQETFTLSLAVYAVYLLSLLLTILATVALTGRHAAPPGGARDGWYWPDPTKAKAYRLLFVVVVLLFLGACVGSILAPRTMAWLCFPYPIALALLSARLLRRDDPASTGGGGTRYWRRCYRWGIVGLLLNVAVVPPFLFYRVIHAEEIAVYRKADQIRMADALRERIGRHVDHFRNVALRAENAGEIRESLRLKNEGNDGIEDALDVYAPGWTIHETFDGAPESGKPSRQSWIAFLSNALPSQIPGFNDYAAETRALADPDPGPRRWSVPKRDRLRLTIDDFRPPVTLGSGDRLPEEPENLNLVLESLLVFRVADQATWWIWVAILFALLLVLQAEVMRNCLNMVFLWRMRFPLSIDGKDVSDKAELDRELRLRWRVAPGDDAFELGILAFRDAESGADLVTRIEQCGKARILLSRFDYGLDEPEIASIKLEVLEYLGGRDDLRVAIESSIDPLFFLTSGAHDSWMKPADEPHLHRWAAALQPFAKLREKATAATFDERREDYRRELGAMDGSGSDEVLDTLVSEGWPNSLLRLVGHTLWRREGMRHYDARDVVELFGDFASAHYRRIWSSCSTDEKLLLHRLAQEGFVNWRMIDTVRSLIKRRLVVNAPDFRLMNESFRRFVLRAEQPAVFQQWEAAAGVSAWSRLRTPLIASGVVIAGFFMVTQRELFNQTLGMLTVFTAGVPVLIRLLVSMPKSPTTPPRS
jgi:hypothetical protein